MADLPNAALAGKRIVVTRAPAQAAELREALKSCGAEVLLLPLVAFEPVRDSPALDEALAGIAAFDAVLFLSANAVRYVFERCRELAVAFDARSRPAMIAAVGPATARALEERGIRADYVARETTAAALARELKDSLAGRSVLLPRSDRGADSAPHALREIGARIAEVVVYRTALPKEIDAAIAYRIRRREVDAVLFASPSAVHNFLVAFGAEEASRIGQSAYFAAIGPATAQALRGANLPVSTEASESSTQGLLEALIRAFSS